MLTPPAHRRGAGPAGIAATAIALLLLRALPVSAQLSPRNANYTIDARLDPVARTIDGRATLVWRNLSDRPATDLRFHLYWNAWAHNRSTWMREAALVSYCDSVRLASGARQAKRSQSRRATGLRHTPNI